MRILVVEDDKKIASFVVRGLKEAGFAVDHAAKKTSALFVKTSRAGLIADGALVEALKAGHPGFAAVDVYEDEPVIGADPPLLKMNNVTCPPHLVYVTPESYKEYYGVVVDDILAFAAGNASNVLNPEALGKK